MSMFSSAAADYAETIVKQAVEKAKDELRAGIEPEIVVENIYKFCERKNLFSE